MTTWTKDPAAYLDYAFSWTAWVAAGETITDATVTVTDGPTEDEETENPLDIDDPVTNTDTVVTAWIAGGQVGQRYTLMCHIETNQDRIDERSVKLSIRER